MSAARLIPWVLHELVEYVAGVFLILAPFLFFLDVLDETAAFPLFVGVGVALVAVQLFTRGKAGIAELLPVRVHATLDYLVAIFLIVSPFLFGLTADDQPPAALLIPILLGVGHLVITLLTRFPLEAPAAAADAAPASGSGSSAAGAETSSGSADTRSTQKLDGSAGDAEGSSGSEGDADSGSDRSSRRSDSDPSA